MTNKEFEEFLVSIGGLKNGFYPDRPNIVTNICECADGWLSLIKELIEKAIELGWNKEICQIKEKFGGLRFYINGATDEVYNLISEYENKSFNVCEICGKEGKLYKSGYWLSTRCEEHKHESDVEVKW